MIKMINDLVNTISTLKANGTIEFLHINEAPTGLVKHVASGLHSCATTDHSVHPLFS